MNDSIRDTIKVDTARLPLLLNELRLPTIAALWPDFTERADREGGPRHGSWRLWPNSNSPNGLSDASSDT
jgi:hypothetical protein